MMEVCQNRERSKVADTEQSFDACGETRNLEHETHESKQKKGDFIGGVPS